MLLLRLPICADTVLIANRGRVNYPSHHSTLVENLGAVDTPPSTAPIAIQDQSNLFWMENNCETY